MSPSCSNGSPFRPNWLVALAKKCEIPETSQKRIFPYHNFFLSSILSLCSFFLLVFHSRSSLQSSSLHLILYPSRPSTYSMPYTTLLPLGFVLVIHDCYSLLPQPRSTFPAPLQTIQHPLLFHDYFDVPRLSSNRSPTLDSKELDLNFGENIPSAYDPLYFASSWNRVPSSTQDHRSEPHFTHISRRYHQTSNVRSQLSGGLFIIQCTSSSENVRLLTTTTISIRSSSPQ